MKLSGAVLVIFGLLTLILGEIRYSRQVAVLDSAPMRAPAADHQAVPVSPLVGAIAIVSGLLLMITPGRRFS